MYRQMSLSESHDAVLSDDRHYRYALWRVWIPEDGYVLFIGLNPSTADEVLDDPTVRRCVGFAERWGFGGVYIANLFALRATDPRVLKKAHVHGNDIVGPANDVWLTKLHEGACLTVAAWGAGGGLLGRDKAVTEMLLRTGNLRCLGTTRDGHPRHPLYLPNHTKPVLWKEGDKYVNGEPAEFLHRSQARTDLVG